MAYQINEKVRSLTPYDPIEGDYPIRLDANESFLPITQEERAALQAAAERVDLRRYPDPLARRLCTAAGEYYGVLPEFITAGNGLDEILSLLASAFLPKGSRLLCFECDFSMYAFYGCLAEADCVRLPRRADYSIDVAALLAALEASRPALLLFSNPCNPTSLVLPRGDIRRIIRAAEKSNTLVALDEAYMDFSNQSLLGEFAQYDNLVLLRTCSKAAGLAGLRLGFAFAGHALTKTLRAVKSPYNVGALTQAAGEALLKNGERLQSAIAQIKRSRAALSQGLRKLAVQFPGRLAVVGDEANFVFVQMECAQAAFEALKGKGIIVRCFGAALRITAGSAEENAALLSNLELFLRQDRI
ncbi:MAG: histidinol-phosphate aminotransferase family protein [Oscillospiraceae bacterium]|jgi:histidinol-phosphate aminotransferase|nr:histidinol-phosphate aminotransferase family protein [Oscillospiraceae bacterium]